MLTAAAMKPNTSRPPTGEDHTDAPRGIWLGPARLAPADQPYPCLCDGRCHPKWCPCAGRTDLESVPSGCCAARNTPAVAAAAWRSS